MAKQKFDLEQLSKLDLRKEMQGKYLTGADLTAELIIKLTQKKEFIEGLKSRNWRLFNKYLGGQRPGEVGVITSDTGIGKTTFAINWAADTMAQDREVCYFAFENSPLNVLEQTAKITIGEGLSRPLEKEDANLLKIFGDTDARKITFYDGGYEPIDEDILKAIFFAKQQLKIKHFFIDHLDAVFLTIQRHETPADAMKRFMLHLLNLAKALEITIVCIHHPSKLGDKGGYREKQRGDRWIMADELKGGSSVKQVADFLILLRRPSDMENGLEMKFDKIRNMYFGPNMGKKIKFVLDVDTQTFVEVDEDEG